MATVDIKYVSLTGLTKFLDEIKNHYSTNTNNSNEEFKVNYAQRAIGDSDGNSFQSTYIKDVLFVASGGNSASPSTLPHDANGAVTINLSNYALKGEVAAAMQYKGSADVNSLVLTTDNIKAGDVYTQSGSTDVAGTGSNTGMTFHPGYEYVAKIDGTESAPVLHWVELGNWFNHDTLISKKTTATVNNLVSFASGGDIEDSGIAKSKFTGGSVASGNDSFVTGGTVYTYLNTASNHQKNTIEKVKVNGTTLTIDSSDLSVDISVPTDITEVKYVTADPTGGPITYGHVDNLLEAAQSEIAGLFV